MSTPKVYNAVVCEDIRVENTGKNILIGVYANDLNVTIAPAVLRIAIWLQFEGIEPQGAKFEFRSTLAGKKKFDGKVTINAPAVDDKATVSLGPFLLRIEEGGDLRVDVRFEDSKRWKTVIKMPVLVRPLNSIS